MSLLSHLSDTTAAKTDLQQYFQDPTVQCSFFLAHIIVKQTPPANIYFKGRLANSVFESHMLFSREPMDADVEFMHQALHEARAAAQAGEVPIGSVLVHEGKIIARSGNRTIRDCDPTAHAEIVVLRDAARRIGNYRLPGTTLYVTIEPCSMCCGAIIQARVPRVVYGCDDPKGGAVRSCFQVLSHPSLNHQVELTAGVLTAECAAVIQSFFGTRRQ
jgi:tRNA(adenine34) deaminase